MSGESQQNRGNKGDVWLPHVSKFYKICQRARSAGTRILQIRKTIQVADLIPDIYLESDGDDALYCEGDGRLEIMVAKKFSLQLFKECHDYFNEFLFSSTSSQKQSIEKSLNELELTIFQNGKLFTLYKVTMGLLLTTPGNNTAMHVHYLIVLKVMKKVGEPAGEDTNLKEWLSFELDFVKTLICSAISRINKSSILWLLYKKLLVFLRFHPCFTKQIASVKGSSSETLITPTGEAKNELEVLCEEIFQVVLISASNHPRNYYSWNFMRWAIHIFQYLGFAPFKNNTVNSQFQLMLNEKLYREVTAYCRKNLSDSSAWHVLLELVIPVTNSMLHSFEETKHIMSEATDSSFDDMLAEKVIQSFLQSASIEPRLKAIITDHLQFLQTGNVLNEAPWNFFKEALLRLSSHNLLKTEVSRSWMQLEQETNEFSKDHYKIKFEKGKFLNHDGSLQKTQAFSVTYQNHKELMIIRNKVRILSLYKTFYQSI